MLSGETGRLSMKLFIYFSVHCIPYGDWNVGLPQTGP